MKNKTGHALTSIKTGVGPVITFKQKSIIGQSFSLFFVCELFSQIIV